MIKTILISVAFVALLGAAFLGGWTSGFEESKRSHAMSNVRGYIGCEGGQLIVHNIDFGQAAAGRALLTWYENPCEPKQ